MQLDLQRYTLDASCIADPHCIICSVLCRCSTTYGCRCAALEGGAIYAGDTAQVKLQDTSFVRNTAVFGGGLLLYFNATGVLGLKQSHVDAEQYFDFANSSLYVSIRAHPLQHRHVFHLNAKAGCSQPGRVEHISGVCRHSMQVQSFDHTIPVTSWRKPCAP
jgi:hypothetical protein